MSTRVVDLGAGTDPDPRASETVDLYARADHTFDLAGKWDLDDASVDGLIARHVVEHLEPEHVFQEAGRVLRDGGWFEVTVPLGENARTDPDHSHAWSYTTPEMFCRRNRRHWDPKTPFELVERDLDVWCLPPLTPLSPLLQAIGTQWPNWAAYRCGAGELTARYRRLEREAES